MIDSRTIYRDGGESRDHGWGRSIVPPLSRYPIRAGAGHRWISAGAAEHRAVFGPLDSYNFNFFEA